MQELLKKVGIASFRPGQKEVIASVLEQRHTLGILPTGSGKTLCYQLPSHVFEGMVLVVSPLISLMEDQVNQLKMMGERQVDFVNSTQNKKEKKQVLKNIESISILYVSPEMLQQTWLVDRLNKRSVSLFVVDEAHCLSQWGHDFRPEYRRLDSIREKIGSPPVLALTATAPPEVEKDICQQLSIERSCVFRQSVDRENIFLEKRDTASAKDKWEMLSTYLSKVEKPCLVYTGTRLEAEEGAALLDGAAFYHGGLPSSERTLIQSQFLYNQAEVLFATNAFGMGVNKPDIRTVIHAYMPGSIEQFVQEIGRAGRDGHQARSVILHAPDDPFLPHRFIEQEYPDDGWLEHTFYPAAAAGHTLDELQLPLEISDDMLQMLRVHLEDLGLLENNRLREAPDALKKIQELNKRYQRRMQYKRNQLKQMNELLSSRQCIRSGLLSHFGEKQQDKPSFCCTNCGESLPLPDTVSPGGGSPDVETWQDRLKLLLYPEESS
ncbi:RecQ family ATP-dependent DNA helicase [Alkalicoccus chagannorensis]|uniref:RecQ family ATP-dependent DNA helicase n=1 Tax=Alkalicoccus chagannorensis TaxID=427072 RepID=UPI0004061050|nr:RecQ family ATP-dependent DNA helicase [Alkalicoccus chagannorensis]